MSPSDLNNYAKILETLQIVNKYPVNVRLIPDLFQLLTLKANIQDLDGYPGHLHRRGPPARGAARPQAGHGRRPVRARARPPLARSS